LRSGIYAQAYSGKQGSYQGMAQRMRRQMKKAQDLFRYWAFS
jgi:hypothetical protein